MNKKRIGINALTASIQVVLAGIILFIIYRYLLDQLGADLLGVWSLIMATTSIVNLANFGLTSGLVKFVSEYNILNQKNELYKLLFTSLFSTIVLLITISILIIWGSKYFLHYFIDSKNIDIALSILPYSVFCLNINVIGGVFTSTLEGFQKNYLRHIIYIIGLICFLSSCLILVPILNIYGVIYSQIFQSFLILSISLFICIFKFKIHPTSISNIIGWDISIFKKLFSFGGKFQIITISQMFLEPTTKMILSKFGGVGAVAYYEMALRLISQIRSLIISANQILLPVVAEKNISDKKALKNIYVKTFKIIITVGFPLLTLLFIAAQLISNIWVGQIQPAFITYTYILICSSFVVILNGPAYFGILGEGKLNIMVVVYIFMALLNAIIAYLFTIYISKTYGAVIGSALISMIATYAMSIYYQKTHKIELKDLIGKNEVFLFFTAIIVCCISYLNSSVYSNLYIPFLINFLIFSIPFSILLYKQSIKLGLVNLLRNKKPL